MQWLAYIYLNHIGQNPVSNARIAANRRIERTKTKKFCAYVE